MGYIEEHYWPVYKQAFKSKMCEKLGLIDSDQSVD